MTLYLCNGFSESMKRDPNMLNVPYSLTKDEFIKLIKNSNFESVIGHESLAECLTELTGEKIQFNRKGITLNYDDTVIVISLNGRLPEHPTFVEYDGRLNFTFMYFEKQTQSQRMKAEHKIKTLTEA